MLGSEPDTLDVDVLSKIPDLLGGVDGIGVISVHDACIVEHDVDTAPSIEVVDESLDIGFLGDVTDLSCVSIVKRATGRRLT